MGAVAASAFPASLSGSGKNGNARRKTAALSTASREPGRHVRAKPPQRLGPERVAVFVFDLARDRMTCVRDRRLRSGNWGRTLRAFEDMEKIPFLWPRMKHGVFGKENCGKENKVCCFPTFLSSYLCSIRVSSVASVRSFWFGLLDETPDAPGEWCGRRGDLASGRVFEQAGIETWLTLTRMPS